MSRTYRELPHSMTKESLCRDFAEGFYRVFHCGGTFRNAAHYAKATMAKERSDAAIFKGLLREVTGIAPNGSPLGYKEWTRSHWAKRFASKARRINDKSIIGVALLEMNDIEVEQPERDYDHGHWSYFDDWLHASEEFSECSLFVYDDYYPEECWP